MSKPLIDLSVLMSVIIASMSLTAIAPFIMDFTRAASAASELFQLIDRKSQIDPFDPSGEQPASVIGDIQFHKVSFSYPMRPGITVLDDFSLHIPAGKVTALVGASGSGKSTIIGLLERWYNLDSGTITLDGQPIDQLNIKWLRKQIQLVQQEPVLFAGTVYDNISSGLVGTPWENDSKENKLVKVQEAAEIAFAHGFISDLPNGYDTVVGERGGLLSGGQKQRVAIARSIVSKPPILLLDEATSALDPHSEEVVQKALDKVSKGRTTITIAHKLATIRHADNIVVMNQGRIVEQGSHDSLLQANGAYARLVQAQDLSVTKDSSESETDTSMDDGPEETPAETTKTLTQYSTSTRDQQTKQSSRDDFDSWKTLGILRVVWRILRSTPEAQWSFSILVVLCFISGKRALLHGLCSSLTDLFLAAAFPGQAILMSRFIEVFKFRGDEMQKKANFIALMFLVLAIGVLFTYFIVGWSSNLVGQVSLYFGIQIVIYTHFIPGHKPQVSQTDNFLYPQAGYAILRPSRKHHRRFGKPRRLIPPVSAGVNEHDNCIDHSRNRGHSLLRHLGFGVRVEARARDHLRRSPAALAVGVCACKNRGQH